MASIKYNSISTRHHGNVVALKTLKAAICCKVYFVIPMLRIMDTRNVG